MTHLASASDETADNKSDSAAALGRTHADTAWAARTMVEPGDEADIGSLRTVCVLFADVAGSTRLYERLGDAEALHAVDRCLKRMVRVAEGYGGRVIKTIGDEILTVFGLADSAFQAACEMQQRVDDLPPASGIKLAIRVGFHRGPVIEENNDVFGDSVNVASRLTDLAKAGQIITSHETIEALSAPLRGSVRELAQVSVKGKESDTRVFEVMWQGSADMTMLGPSPVVRPLPHTRLKVRHQNVSILIDNQRSQLTLGRELGNDIVIADRRSSRTHARIDRRRDKFVLVDVSSNGTYVTFDGELEVALKREEIVLRGRGRICFGRSYADDAETVEFELIE
jgi:adenylate cyclase